MKKTNFRCFVLAVVAVVVLAFLAGCSAKANKWQDGTFNGEAKGNNGPLKVTVQIANGKIAEVKVTEQNETPGISDAALEKIPKAVVEKQSWDVDTVSGATNTSNAIREAVKAALAQAEKK